jgi:hypothetical protein
LSLAARSTTSTIELPALNEAIHVKSTTINVLYVVLMVAVIVIVDVVFFKNRFLSRLLANAGIVVVFAAFYFAFLKRR